MKETIKDRTLTIVMKDGTIQNIVFPSVKLRKEAQKLLDKLIREKRGPMYI